MRKRSTLAALVLALTLTGAVAFAQSAGQGADLGARLAELQARARRLELLAGVPAEARAQAEELIDRQEELKLAEQELEVERLEALVAALEAGDSPAVARQVAESAIAERRVELERRRETLREDVDAFVEQYPEAASAVTGLLRSPLAAVRLVLPEGMSGRLVLPEGVSGGVAALRVRPGLGGPEFSFHRPGEPWPRRELDLFREARPGVRLR